ncbi:unnamed protein product [marine sediment metagenome]|uniref:Uncharacterized protein n=1 Tax=marine sediment metagenome TaxID=412755 RepID=X0VRV1_9ZZZZ
MKKVVWCGSQAEASRKRKLIRQRHGYIPNSVQTTPINISTKKDQFIKFINESVV